MFIYTPLDKSNSKIQTSIKKTIKFMQKELKEINKELYRSSLDLRNQMHFTQG